MKLKVIQNILIIIVFLALAGAIGWGVYNTVHKVRALNINFKSMSFDSLKPDDFKFDFLQTGFRGFNFTQGFKGPGGCASEKDCLEYCKNQKNQSECKNFIDKISQNILDNFTGPGGCKGVEECQKYCQESSHNQECLQYGELF